MQRVWLSPAYWFIQVCALIEFLVTNVYGRRHPNVVVAGKPRIDLPYSARELAKTMLRERENEFLQVCMLM